MKQIYKNRYNLFFVLAALLIIVGCKTTSGNFGKLSHNDGVTNSFESYHVNPEYNYFYSGPQTFPKAVIGISKKFTLESNLWHPIELTPDQLKDWIYHRANRIIPDVRNNGSYINDPNGDHLGVWYSLRDWQQWARIEIDGNTLKIGGPLSSRSGKKDGLLYP